MNLALTRYQLRKLAIDEMAVVLYLRLVFLHLPVAVILGFTLGYLTGGFRMDEPAHKGLLATLCWGSAVFAAWLIWVLWDIRKELLSRPSLAITYTPTFLLWGRFAKGVVFLSLCRHLLRDPDMHDLIVGFGMGAWMLSCLMAGFYFTYMLIVVVMGRLPSFGTLSVFLFSLAGSWIDPAELVK